MPIIAVIGPSGAGKSTLVDMYIAKHPNAILHKTVTTRPRRNANDNSHTFVTDAEFDALEREGKLIYSAPAYGFRYAMPLLPDDTNKTILVLLRIPFVAEFLKLYPYTRVLQIEACIDTLAARLAVRGDHDRIDNIALQKEIERGRIEAHTTIINNKTFDTSYSQFEDACTVHLK